MRTPHAAAGSAEWYTPPFVVRMVRDLLGSIELDPFSCAQANKLVRAERYFDSDGLELEWKAKTCFVNPPGGKSRLTQKAWTKLEEAYLCEDVLNGAFLSFSLDTLQTTQRHTFGGIAAYPTFIFDRRFCYFEPGPDGVPVQSKSALRPSCLTVLPEGWYEMNQDRFMWKAKSYTDEKKISGVWVVGFGWGGQ